MSMSFFPCLQKILTVHYSRLKERIVINVDRARTSQESIAEMNIRGTLMFLTLTLCILS